MEISAQKREILGKKVKSLRKGGFAPAELYGQGKDNVHLSVPTKEFLKIYKEAGESTLVDVIVDGKKTPALIQDVIFNPVTQEIANIDFHAVKMDKKIRTEVELEFINESPASKSGGVLVKSMKEIEVEALPKDLPQSIEVDLSKLENIHDCIYVKDLKVGEKVKILVDAENVVATVVEPVKEEEVAPAISVEDVKIESEEKKKDKEKEEKPSE